MQWPGDTTRQQFPENRERLSISRDLNGRRAYLSADTAVS